MASEATVLAAVVVGWYPAPDVPVLTVGNVYWERTTEAPDDLDELDDWVLLDELDDAVLSDERLESDEGVRDDSDDNDLDDELEELSSDSDEDEVDEDDKDEKVRDDDEELFGSWKKSQPSMLK